MKMPPSTLRLLAVAAIVQVSSWPETRAREGQSSPQFRARTDLVRFDVTVLDADRRPVRGLVAGDFVVLEDGKEQTVSALTEIDLPDPPRVPAPWMRDAPADVQSNNLDGRRLVVIVIDDATGRFRLSALEESKAVVRRVVDRLGSGDLTSIVSTVDNRLPEDFTTDRARLLAAIDRMKLGWAGSATRNLLEVYSVKTLLRAAQFLIDAPERRKALIYISFGVPWTPLPIARDPRLAAQQSAIGAAVDKVLRDARRANVTVYSVLPKVELPTIEDRSASSNYYLHKVSDETGGFVVASGDLDEGITQIFRESGAYYVLGYIPTNPVRDGKFRRVTVTVRRPGLTVRARDGYDADPIGPVVKPGKAPPSPLVKALAGVLPDPELPLQVSVAPFAVPNARIPGETTLAITVAAKQPAVAALTTKQVELLVMVFDPEGRQRGWKKQVATVQLRPAPGDQAQFEVLTRMPVAPGQYNVRVSATDVTDKKNGSVYTTVNVPNFVRDPVSLAGVLLTAAPGLAAAPRDALVAVVPVIPTTIRTFTAADRVRAFLRVYQAVKKGAEPAPVALTVRVLTEQDTAAVDTAEMIPAARFATDRAADLQLDLPIARLAPGAYLLQIEVTLPAGQTAKREVRFAVR